MKILFYLGFLSVAGVESITRSLADGLTKRHKPDGEPKFAKLSSRKSHPE
jgi:hypothetical protein